MSEDLYYVIYNREDGASLREMTHDQLIHALNDEYFGPDLGEFDLSSGHVDLTADCGLTIIKGRVVTPKPETVVKTWRL